MKTFKFISLSIVIAFWMLFTFSGSVNAATTQDCGTVILGDSCVLRTGQSIHGDMVIFGGSASLEDGSTVNGDIVLTGGSLEVHGVVNGSIVSTGGFVHLYENAIVNGDITRIGGNLVQDSGAKVTGELITSSDPGDIVPDVAVNPSNAFNFLKPIGNFFLSIFQALAFATIAIIVALISPKGNERMAQTITSRFGLSLGIGALGMLVVLFGSLILAVTIIGIPLVLLVLMVFFVALLYGWFGLGLELGKRVARLFKTTWSTPITAGVGTLLLSLGAAAIGWVPCLGQLIVLMVTMVGFGAVVLTRFGSRYPDGVSDTPVQLIPSIPAAVVSTPVVEPEKKTMGTTQMVDEDAIKKMVKDASEKPASSKPEEPLPPEK